MGNILRVSEDANVMRFSRNRKVISRGPPLAADSGTALHKWPGVASVLCKRDNYLPTGCRRTQRKHGARGPRARLNRTWELIKSRCILSAVRFAKCIATCYVSKATVRIPALPPALFPSSYLLVIEVTATASRGLAKLDVTRSRT